MRAKSFFISFDFSIFLQIFHFYLNFIEQKMSQELKNFQRIPFLFLQKDLKINSD
tara:strand:+ start:984 stop:1148 length:165 start_codon:yes stop_codon:yes gene_type:complete